MISGNWKHCCLQPRQMQRLARAWVLQTCSCSYITAYDGFLFKQAYIPYCASDHKGGSCYKDVRRLALLIKHFSLLSTLPTCFGFWRYQAGRQRCLCCRTPDLAAYIWEKIFQILTRAMHPEFLEIIGTQFPNLSSIHKQPIENCKDVSSTWRTNEQPKGKNSGRSGSLY